MKKLFTLAVAAIAAIGAYAQYAATEVGTVLKYNVFQDDKNVISTTTVQSVEPDGDQTKVTYLEHFEIPGSLKTIPDMTTFALCDPANAEAPTKIVMMSKDVFKDIMLSQIRQEAEGAGQMVTDEQMEQVAAMIRPTGELALTLDPTAAPEAKIPNSSLRISMEMMSMTMGISSAKVLGHESVTTPAGEFADCLKVYYVQKENAGPESTRTNVTAWYAPGIGLVKEEGTDKKGNVTESQELVSVTRP